MLSRAEFPLQCPNRVVIFTDIEENVDPEVYFLSRQIFLYPHAGYEAFVEDCTARNWSSSYISSPLYATCVRHNVRVWAVRGIFESVVELADTANLMDKSSALPPFSCALMERDQNASLSYLGYFEATGMELTYIPLSGHFPMYSNSPEK